MGKPYSMDLRERVVGSVIAAQFGVAPSTGAGSTRRQITVSVVQMRLWELKQLIFLSIANTVLTILLKGTNAEPPRHLAEGICALHLQGGG